MQKKSRGETVKSKKFFIDGKEYSPDKVFIIAELGSSHGGDIVKARELIDAAAEAGADCIKFQIIYAREILHPNTGEVELPGGKIRLFDRFRELELPASFFAEMKERVEKKGLIFLCTPFGLQSARELKALKPKCVKIASPELNYTALLKEIASYRLPILLSSGVSRLADIEEALETLESREQIIKNREQRTGNRENSAPSSNSTLPTPQICQSICLLHCVSAYPAPEKDYNLRVLSNLSSIFGVSVGISDHSMDPCLIPVLGTAMGASVIEKHFCLSRDDKGLDDPIALPPLSFAQMVREVRKAEKSGPEETLAALYSERGRDFIESILGDGVKRLAPSEMANYERTNRSIHALRNIEKGEIIQNNMIACLRTEKILRPGLRPSWEEKIIGRRAENFIPAGEGIRCEDIQFFVY